MTRPGDLWCRLLKKKEEKNVSEMFFHHFHHFWSGENGHKMVSFVPSKNLFKQIFKYEQLTLGCFSTHKRAESPLMGGETPCSRRYGSRTNSTIVIQWWQWWNLPLLVFDTRSVESTRRRHHSFERCRLFYKTPFLYGVSPCQGQTKRFYFRFSWPCFHVLVLQRCRPVGDEPVQPVQVCTGS